MDSMRKTGPRGTTRGRARNPLLVALAALLPVLALLVSPPASAGSALDRIKQSGTLKLGYGPDNPLSKDGAAGPSGFAIDLCNRIADAVKADLGSPNLKVEYVSVTREEGVGAVASGKVDVLCAPLVATAANRKLVSYSIPVFASGVGALVRKDASDRLKDILSGRPAAEQSLLARQRRPDLARQHDRGRQGVARGSRGRQGHRGDAAGAAHRRRGRLRDRSPAAAGWSLQRALRRPRRAARRRQAKNRCPTSWKCSTAISRTRRSHSRCRATMKTCA